MNMEVDWQYSMRREMQEILPGLYLGPYSAATKSRVRHKNNLERIVEACIRVAERFRVYPAIKFVTHKLYTIMKVIL